MPEKMSRSGAEIRRRETQSKVIQERLSTIEHHLGQLCDISSSYTRKTARLRDKGDMMAKQMMEFSDYEKWNPSLSQGMTKCAENLSAVQDYREVQIDLRAAFAASDRESSQKRKLEVMKSKSPGDRQRISQLENELQRASLDASRSNKALEEQVDSFESKKIKDLKKIMREFVTVEMHFHAKALELYTQCFQSLDSIDPDADLDEFRKQLRPEESSIRSDIARSASQASLDSRQNSAQSTPRKLNLDLTNDKTGSANARRKMPLPNPKPTNNTEYETEEEEEDDDDDEDDDDEDDSDDYTETVTEKSGRRR